MQWVKHLRDKSPDIREGAPEEKRRKNSWRRWSSQEDDKLVELVKAGNRWDQCAEQMPGRTKQSCESPWTTKLRSKHPEVSTPMHVKLWTLAEDEELAAHIQDGRNWTWISQQLVGRTTAACIGHWHGDGFGLDARAGLKHTYPNIVYAYAPQERRS